MAAAFEVAEDWESPLAAYGSAAEAAQVYAALAALLPGSCKAQDYERLALGVELNTRPELRASQILALDVRRDLERAWARAQEQLGAEEGERAARLWRCWWAVRVELKSLRTLPEVSKTSAARWVATVDRVVLRVLEQLELRRWSISEDEERRVNTLDPRRVRTAMQVWEDELEQG